MSRNVFFLVQNYVLFIYVGGGSENWNERNKGGFFKLEKWKMFGVSSF